MSDQESKLLDAATSTDRPIVSIVSMGEMGAWIAKRLIAHGVLVRAATAGRSPASRGRASALGVIECEDDVSLLEGAHFVLSVVPPASALATADKLCAALRDVCRKPVYVDLNALSDRSVVEVAARVSAAGAACVDGCIIGAASGKVGAGPKFYVCGPQYYEVMTLARHGLDIRPLGPEIGRASALKCCFAGLHKGLTALALESVVASKIAGVDAALVGALKESAPQLADLLKHLLPEAWPKAPRWVGEMKEIARQYSAVPGGKSTYSAFADLFEAASNGGRIHSEQTDSLAQQFVSALSDAAPRPLHPASDYEPLYPDSDQTRCFSA